MRILITGSNGLVGGAAVEYFDALGHEVHGADNNWRQKFFGTEGDTNWNRHRIFHNAKDYHPTDADITSETDVWSLFHDAWERPLAFDAVIHCAAQPSHDFANSHEQLDYDVNVKGTYNLLEAVRKFSPNAVFIFTSTNKVYDDAVNTRKYWEHQTRYDGNVITLDTLLDGSYRDWKGFDESMPVGASNIFGRHKLAADEMVQRYAKEFGLKTMVLRGGCLTGPGHSGVPLHGFLNYLIRCAATGTKYIVNGYKGKQVRDNIHSYDVARAFYEMIRNPRPGEVYNIGGGRENSISIIEAIEKAEKIIGKKMNVEFNVTPREGDHVCYITDMSKFRRDYPNWRVTKSLDDIFQETVDQLYWGVETEHKETITYPELNEDSLVYDVGGCRGRWAQSILEKYNPCIHIFEPVKEFYDDCMHRFASDSHVIIHKFGLSDLDHRRMIAKQGVNSSTERGGENQAKMPDDPVWGSPIEEEILLLDIADFLGDTRNVDLISINCEGGEYDILNRLIETGDIKKFDNVQVQFHDFHPKAIELRNEIRRKLSLTHTERFCYPFVWESWKRND